uniref:Uncharacterized protein n=1 Tax=Rhizobium leguminosarum bv. viciae TaxID=387 RepID=A0A0U2QRF3_RHILV|nr:hypothetical protein [Rhizobium leguminosarum bv. viciae]
MGWASTEARKNRDFSMSQRRSGLPDRQDKSFPAKSYDRLEPKR